MKMMKKKNILSIILAAGEGTRMKSSLPKVLHRISGKPMIEYVLDSVTGAGCRENYVVVGYEKEKVKKAIRGNSYKGKVKFIEQSPLLGSGHAVMQAKKLLGKFTGDIVVTCGDVPLLTTKTLKCLINFHASQANDTTVLTAVVDNPFGYGRVIVSANGRVTKIVEERDATHAQRTINRINTGIYCFKARELFKALDKVKPDNKKKEYYLTDVVKIMSGARKKVGFKEAPDSREVAGVNTAGQLAMAEKYLLRGKGK